MKLLLTLALPALLAGTASLRGQNAPPEFDPLGEHDELPKMIRVQVEFIEVSHESLTELLSEDDGKSDRALRKKVGELVAAGEASMMETQMLVTRSGQKAVAESIEEFIYPTEYEPAEVPTEIHTTADGEKVRSDGKDFAVGPTPTAFETRNIGSTIELEPLLSSNNQLIELRCAPEIVYHVGNEIWSEWKGNYGESPIQMPIFYTLRASLSVTLLDREPRLVAALSPKGDDGFPAFSRKVIIFVRADVLTVGR